MFVANWWILWLLGLGSLNPNQPNLGPSPYGGPQQAIGAIQAQLSEAEDRSSAPAEEEATREEDQHGAPPRSLWPD